MNILIIEDELIIAEMLSDYIQEMGYHVLGKARNYTEAIQLIKDCNPDFLLIDINLGGKKTGIDVAHYINQEVNIPFIFITSNADEATVNEAKKTNPFGYLQKPFNKNDIYSAIEVAMVNFERLNNLFTEKKNNESKHLFIKDGSIFKKITIEEILFIKSDGNYLEIYTESDKVLLRSTLKNFTEKLPQGLFIYTNRSHLVNMTKIESFGPSFVHVLEHKIPLSKSYKDDFLSVMLAM